MFDEVQGDAGLADPSEIARCGIDSRGAHIVEMDNAVSKMLLRNTTH